MDLLEEFLTKSASDYLTGNELTIADLQIFYELTDLISMQLNWDSYPKISAWYDRIDKVKEVEAVETEWKSSGYI